jgi:tetratricopeptide (TPR) repeat protein
MPSPDSAALSDSAPAPRGWRGVAARFQRQSRSARTLQAGALALVVIAACLSLVARRPNPLLSTPALALEGLHAKSLYYNGPAWPWLRDRRPDLLGESERYVDSARVRSFTQAVQNPKLFRQLDRQERFDKLLLIGDPSQYRPLLEHLVETKDWTVAYVDHMSLIFQRAPATAWQVGQVDALLDRFRGAPARDRAAFLALTAAKLVALHDWPAARTLLDRARALDARAPEVWSVQAQYHLGRGEWKDCEAAADRALELERGHLAAMGTKAQVLYSTKRFNEAYALSRKLIERLPDDPGMLFYHAKIAHEARALGEEARVLRRLILLAEQEERPTSGYRVYLGQSLASAGEAGPALEEFGKAMADPDLPKPQRDFAEDCVKLIRSQGP